MSDYTYIDLLVTDDDISLDAGNNPLFVTDADCIAQDIKHMIRESGLVFLMIAERNQNRIKRLTVELKILIETDTRIKPGTVVIQRIDTKTFQVTATTVAFGDIEVAA